MSLYIGTNYHPHDWNEEQWKIDIDLMKKAGFNTVRLGHLCWDSYEPEEGVYTFEWFDRVMDLFAEANIGVLLDISMRPAPVWVHKLCPGCTIYSKGGQPMTSIRRYMEDVDDPSYQYYALRFAKILVNRYKNHKALFAFGLCNELGAGFISYSEYARRRFCNWLKKKYQTIEVLNDVWATRRWSRRLSSFDDVVFPENELVTGAPEPYLDMRRFFSDGIGNFIIKLKNVVSENAPFVPHSSNHYSGKDNLGFDYLKIYDQFVDYPGIGFYPGYDMDEKLQYCNFCYQERLSETGKPAWCLEFQTGRDGIFCGPKGYLRMQAHLRLMNRAQMILGWTWRSMLNGEEQFHHGIIGHDGYPTPNYEEMKLIASDMKKMETLAFPYLPKPEIAVAFDQENLWITQIQPGQFRQSYTDAMIKIQQIFYDGSIDYNMINLTKIKLDYKLLIIPNHILMNPAAAQTIRSFVKKGGTAVMTGYSATVDETGKVFDSPRPGYLSDVFGLRVAGFYRTEMEGFHSPDSVIIEKNGKRRELLTVKKDKEEFSVDVEYYEELELHEARPFAVYKEKNTCAISCNHYGNGAAYYVAAESNQQMISWLLSHLMNELGINNGISVPEGILARKISENLFYYINTTKDKKEILLNRPGYGVLSEKAYDTRLVLDSYGVELLTLNGELQR